METAAPQSRSGFANRLKALRGGADLTQAELARRAGLHPQSLVKLEAGDREPSWQTVRALARALGLGVGAFDVGELPQSADPARGRPRPPVPDNTQGRAARSPGGTHARA
jgi:DNA-binding XRE family transcriptional regulator